MNYKIITIIITSLFILGSCTNSDNNIGGQEVDIGSVITSETIKFKELSSEELKIQLQKDLKVLKKQEEEYQILLEERMKEDDRLFKIQEEKNIKELEKRMTEELDKKS